MGETGRSDSGANRSATSRPWLIGLAALIALEAAKLLLNFGMGQPVPELDAAEYWHIAGQFCQGDYLLREYPIAHRTPGYPGILALFRATAGTYALLATVALQHLLVLATSLLSAWICVRLTGSLPVGVIAYAASVLCITRLWYANLLLTETVFAFLLVAHVAAAVAALQRLTLSRAAMLGVTLGLCILVRPVAQALWIPVLSLILLYALRDNSAHWRRHLGCMSVTLATAAALVAPWYYRNQQVFGEPFLTRFLGRELWISSFAEGAGAGLAYPPGASAARVLDIIEKHDEPVDLRHHWSVWRALMQAELSDAEADRLMQQVATTAIRRHPGQFVESVFRRGVNYWRVVERRFPFFGDVEPQRARRFGQAVWYSTGLRTLYKPLLEHSPAQSLWWNTLVAALTWIGVAGLLWTHATRRYGLLLAGIFLYFASLTAVLEIPNYRYRMVIEPLMIVAAIVGNRQWAAVPRRRHSANGPTT